MQSKFNIGDEVKCINPHQNFLIRDKTYHVSCNTHPHSTMDKFIRVIGSVEYFFEDRFELVSKVKLVLSMEEQIKLAKSFIGKEINYVIGTSSHLRFTPTKMMVYLGDTRDGMSPLVIEEFEKSGFVVVVYNKLQSIPVMVCSLYIPQFKEVKLNSEYTAKVYENQIVVGCQTIPISVIGELNKALKELKNG